MSKRVNVNFSDEVYSALSELARTRGTTLSDVLRDALSLEKYVADTRRDGGKFLVWTPDGETRELLVR